MKSALSILILILILSGCKAVTKAEDINIQNEEMEELKTEISVLKQKLIQLEDENYFLSLNYTMFHKEIQFNQCVVMNSTNLRLIPFALCETTRMIEKNTLVSVVATVDVLKGIELESWLLVKVVTYDSADNIGWIKESETTLLTKENRTKVMSPVRLRRGCINLENSKEKLNLEKDYFIYRIEEEVAYIGAEDGWKASVNKKYIEYPKLQN